LGKKGSCPYISVFLCCKNKVPLDSWNLDCSEESISAVDSVFQPNTALAFRMALVVDRCCIMVVSQSYHDTNRIVTHLSSLVAQGSLSALFLGFIRESLLGFIARSIHILLSGILIISSGNCIGDCTSALSGTRYFCLLPLCQYSTAPR
jgi:hypothetical protein